jgi:uncharacterized protein (TIGR02285 family)
MTIKQTTLVYCYLILLSFHVVAETGQDDVVYIHSEVLTDFKDFKNGNPINDLSVATNLHAFTPTQQTIIFEYMTTKRSLLFMERDDKNVCVVNKIKTKERLDKYIFSLPINLFLGYRLYQHNTYTSLSGYASFDKKLSLDELFKQLPDARVLISDQISYGDALDTQLTSLPHKNKILRSSREHDTGIIKMFEQGYAEFSILYPQQVYKYKPGLKGRSYAIASSPPFILGHLMCTKTKTTRAFIKQINNNLTSDTNYEQLLDIHLKFIRPTEQLMFKHYFNQAF